MKWFSKLPKIRTSFFWGLSFQHPILLLDAYRHSFTFVTIKDPRTESGITFAFAILKFQISVAFYVEKPYEVRSKIMRKMREQVYAKKD